MENYIDGDVFLNRLDSKPLSEEAMTKFQRQFEKLVVLDYIIRNTGRLLAAHSVLFSDNSLDLDRNMSNWLVKAEVKQIDERDKARVRRNIMLIFFYRVRFSKRYAIHIFSLINEYERAL